MPYIFEQYARFDPAESRTHGAHFKHVPSWMGVYIYLLKHGDSSAAELVRGLNEGNADLIAARDSQVPLMLALDAKVPVERRKSNLALVRIRYCIDCGNPTTGSIGAAGYFWAMLCQVCKNHADGLAMGQAMQVSQAVQVCFGN